jgi:hypothetical protein
VYGLLAYQRKATAGRPWATPQKMSQHSINEPAVEK